MDILKYVERIKKQRRIGYNYNPSSTRIQPLDLDFSWLLSTVEEQQKEIERLKEINQGLSEESRENFEVANKFKKQNSKCRKQLELIIADTHATEFIELYVDVKSLIRERASKALEELDNEQ